MAAAKEHKDLSEATLTARLRDAGKGPIPFVFALSKSGKTHYLVLHKIKTGKSLLTFVRGKQPDAGKAAYGTAKLTPTGLELDCEKELPGMLAAAKAWVAAVRNPKVKKIKVLVGGQEVADPDAAESDEQPTEDPHAVALAKLKKAVDGRLESAIEGAAPDDAEKLRKLPALAAKREKAGDVAGAVEVYKAVVGLMKKAAGGGTDGGAALKAALSGWQSARTAAFAQLQALGKAIADTKEPEVKELLIALKSIKANLTESPDDPKKVKELERYLATDDVLVDVEQPNPFGFTVAVRKPLRAALKPLQAAVSAT